jgi:hypothetical protein
MQGLFVLCEVMRIVFIKEHKKEAAQKIIKE